MTLSAWTNTPLEQVKKESACENMWMNVYLFKHGRAARLIRQAEAAGFKAIVITVDIPIFSRRRGSTFYRDIGKY